MKFLPVLLVAVASVAAHAQAAPDWRAVLMDLYRIDMAFDACKNVTPAGADMIRLETVIAYVEEKSGYEEDELDELYGDVEREAAAPDEFCARMSDAVTRLQAVPQEYR